MNELSYYSRLSSGQKLKRTLSISTLNLFQTWFDILSINSSKKVLVSLLLQRLKDFGINENEINENDWNLNECINFETFLDLLANSGLYEKYLNHKNQISYNNYNYASKSPISPITTTPTITTIPKEIMIKNKTDLNDIPIKIRRESVLDLLKYVVGGGVKRVGDVKIHPKVSIKRKDTPPHYTDRFNRLKRFTQVKIFGVTQ